MPSVTVKNTSAILFRHSISSYFIIIDHFNPLKVGTEQNKYVMKRAKARILIRFDAMRAYHMHASVSYGFLFWFSLFSFFFFFKYVQIESASQSITKIRHIPNINHTRIEEVFLTVLIPHKMIGNVTDLRFVFLTRGPKNTQIEAK